VVTEQPVVAERGDGGKPHRCSRYGRSDSASTLPRGRCPAGAKLVADPTAPLNTPERCSSWCSNTDHRRPHAIDVSHTLPSGRRAGSPRSADLKSGRSAVRDRP
jgi:hypothetical protein